MEMENLKANVDKIGRLSRFRYLICTTDLFSKDGMITVVEATDEELRKCILDMKEYYGICKENVELFLTVFWFLLDSCEAWASSFKDFGDNFDFAKEMLAEMLCETLSLYEI